MDGLNEREKRDWTVVSCSGSWDRALSLSVLHGCHSLPAFRKARCPSHVIAFSTQTARQKGKRWENRQPDASTLAFSLQYILSLFIMCTATSANANSNAASKPQYILHPSFHINAHTLLFPSALHLLCLKPLSRSVVWLSTSHQGKGGCEREESEPCTKAQAAMLYITSLCSTAVLH